jgi:RHS repeat-associated protein
MLSICLGKRSLFGRAVAIGLIPTLLLNASLLQAIADEVNAPPIARLLPPSLNIKADRKLPKFTPPSSKFSLSSEPSDQEIFSHSLFSEPLVPVGSSTTPAENADLAKALTAFSERKVRDDYSALERFLATYPTSPWRLSLLVNAGWLYRQTGWYSKAMAAWQMAWTEGQSINDAKAKPFVDRALAELIVLNARVGRMDELEELIPKADARQLTGSSKEKVEAAKQALVLMKTQPSTSFRCGPMALERIRNLQDRNDPSKLKVMSMESTKQGTSMLQLKKLSQKLGLNYQVAKRSPGSAVITPAVINWKLGHYAALLKKEGSLWRLHDPTFGKDVWVSTAAINAEASGYFLVPSGELPTGWQPVDDSDAATVWGKGMNQGPNGNNNKNGPKVGCNGPPGSGGSSNSPSTTSSSSPSMAQYSVNESTTSLSVDDTPLFYKPAYGPTVEFTVSYSQRELNQPSTFDYTNLGPLWTCNWLAFIVDDPDALGIDVTEYESGGGTLTFTGYDSDTQSYAPEQQTNSVLKLTSDSTYEVDYPDGSKAIFGLANTSFPRQVFLTQSVDPQGNALTYSYDSNYRLVAVTDATGLVTTVAYQSANSNEPGFYRIATVTDPFGRSATLTYDSHGNVASSTDMIGIVSQYAYTSGAMTSLTTPYGITTFNIGEDSDKRWVQINDPSGGQQRVETWNNYNTNIPASVSQYPAGADNTFLDLRNSFFWDKEAMMACAGTLDYTKAQITHWLHEPDYSTMSDVPESTKNPLEDRVYYSYLDQPANIVTGTNSAPTQIRRILSNGDTQTTTIVNNSLGLPTQVTDPVGRTTNYTYASDNVDLTQVSKLNGDSNDSLWTATYNAQHQPLVITDASGQTTTYTYNTVGQITSITDPAGEEATCTYNSNGQLASITDLDTGAAITLTYDAYGRISNTEDFNGLIKTVTYDSLNRPIKTIYPDGTYDQNIYTNLDITQRTDRAGHITRYLYNSVQLLTGVVDAEGSVTTMNRCACGALLSLIDARGEQTSWTYNLEGKPLTKTFTDNSIYSYAYDDGYTGHLLSITDPKSQTSSYSYNDDETVAQTSNPDYEVAYTYDPYYPRVTGATKTLSSDSSTYTTTFSYNNVYSSGTPITGGGLLSDETGPLGDTAHVHFSYDSQGRLSGSGVNGVNWTESRDSIGRLLSVSNALGTFSYSYDGTSLRLLTMTNDQNGFGTAMQYQTGSTTDHRFTEVSNSISGGSTLSKFDYTYDSVGNILTWKQQIDANTPNLWTFAYDDVDQLRSGVLKDTSTNSILSQKYYDYDAVGNRTANQSDLSIFSDTFSSLNQITSGGGGGGPLRFTGSINKAGTVQVAGSPASMDSSFLNFSGTANVTTGTNSVPIVATSSNGYPSTNNYQVVVPPSVSISPTYDLNGNMTNNGKGQTYTWDAQNELTAIAYSDGSSTQLVYDAYGHRISIREKDSDGTLLSTKNLVWAGNSVVEEQDATGAVTKRFFAQGEQISGTNYYYTFDHLGSIREMVDGSGEIVARYNYDPYGVVSKLSGSMDSDFQYADYYIHSKSGLNLTYCRAYDPKEGRWISRDPIGESIGSSLYGYAANNPIGLRDPLGLTYADARAAFGFGVEVEAGEEVASLPAAGNLNPVVDIIEGLTAVGLAGYATYELIKPVTQNPANPSTPAPDNTQPAPQAPTICKVPTPIGPPPVPVPGAPDVPWEQTGPQRDGIPTWVPEEPVKTDGGGQPSASWDGEGQGHWDVDDGEGNRQRYDHRGNPITPEQAHDPDAPAPPSSK